MSSTKARAGGGDTGQMDKSVGAIGETLQLVQQSLQPLIEGYGNDSSFSPTDGLDFLQVKNSLLLSYLIDLTVHCRDTYGNEGKEDGDDSSSDASNDDDEDPEEQSSSSTITRLNEMKVVLDKMRGLDKKLRYQIDKLMAADSSATSFATGAENDDDAGDVQQGPSVPEDPLQFRPNPKSLEQDSSSDDDSSEGDDEENADDSENDGSDEDDDDEDLKAARATLSMARGDGKKKRQKPTDGDEDDGKTALYRAPRLTSVPYAHDIKQKKQEKLQQAKRRMRTSEVAQMLKTQYGDTPEQEDIFGGGDLGKQRAAARRMAERDAEKTKYEESTFVRLTQSREEKKERKRLMRQEQSNLSALSSNLNNLVGDNDFDDDNDDGGDGEMPMLPPSPFDNDGGGQRGNSRGKRRGGATGGGRGNKKAKNSLQAALFSSGGGSEKSKKKKSKKKY